MRPDGLKCTEVRLWLRESEPTTLDGRARSQLRKVMRNRRRNLTLLAATTILLVTGCASQQVEKGLQAMVGQPIQAAFGILGYPEGKQSFGNDDVYIWSHERTGGMLMPQVATTYQTYGSQSLYGTVGRTPVYANVSPQTVTSSTLYNQYVPMNAQFRIKLGADARSGIIKTWQWDGNELGAQFFAPVLGQYAKRNTAKLDSEFVKADKDGSGFLDQTEFTQFLAGFWMRKVDTNNDGRVTKLEYVGGGRSETSYRELDSRGRGSFTAGDAARSSDFQNKAGGEFVRADRNRDGKLSPKEFSKGY